MARRYQWLRRVADGSRTESASLETMDISAPVGHGLPQDEAEGEHENDDALGAMHGDADEC
jgi:hypothetical protein